VWEVAERWRIDLENIDHLDRNHKMWGLGHEEAQDVVSGWDFDDWSIIFLHN
jgi:hypothetical protein